VIAPSIGIAVGALVIGYGTVLSALNADGEPAAAAISVGMGLAFVSLLLGRWPLSRRRSVVVAALWFVIGSLVALPVWWATGGSVVPFFAVLASVPALMGAGVGWN
jgi:hypothetical protein